MLVSASFVIAHRIRTTLSRDIITVIYLHFINVFIIKKKIVVVCIVTCAAAAAAAAIASM